MSDRTAPRRAAWCSLVVATTLVMSGCSGLGGDAPPAETTETSSAGPSTGTSGAPSAAPSTTSSGSTPAAEPSASSAPGEALAGRDFTVTGTYTRTEVRMRLDVTELKRRGDLLDLTANITNLEQDGSRDLRWQVAGRFEGSYRKDITSSGNSFSGAVLTDIADKKRYLVAADSAGVCVCTVELSSIFVGAGQSAELSATYAAPPTATTKLDVAIPSLGTFRDLPIS